MGQSITEPSKHPDRGFLPYILVGGILLGVTMALATITLSKNGSTSRSLSLPEIAPAVTVGSSAPDFSASSPDGKIFALSELIGRPVAVNFWATWCAPCKVEMPELESAYQRYTNSNLTIIGVNAGETASVVSAYMLDLAIDFDVVLDPSGDIVTQYGVVAFPTTFWIDGTGIIRAKHIGPLTAEDIDRYVDDLLNQIN